MKVETVKPADEFRQLPPRLLISPNHKDGVFELMRFRQIGKRIMIGLTDSSDIDDILNNGMKAACMEKYVSRIDHDHGRINIRQESEMQSLLTGSWINLHSGIFVREFNPSEVDL